MEQERRRILSFEDAAATLSIQLKLFPELTEEIMTISDGSAGVVQAIIEFVADEISYTPMEQTSPERIRSIVGAPIDVEQLVQWREQFWNQYKASRTQISI